MELYHRLGTSRVYTWTFFLHFINNTVYDIHLFADDKVYISFVEDLKVTPELLNADIEKIAEWSLNWLSKLNPLKLNVF